MRGGVRCGSMSSPIATVPVSPTFPDTTLVLLSYDERPALERLLPRLPRQCFARILAIDPGSTDGTLELYRQHGIEYVLQPQPGRGRAFQLAAQVVDTDRVVFFSADGNEDPNDLERLASALEQGYDMVVAGRYVLPGAFCDCSDDPLRIRKYGAVALGWLVQRLFGGTVWDSINGFRGFSRAALQRLALDAPGHDVELQSTIRGAAMGLHVLEIPTREQPRLGGERKATAGTLRLIWSMTRRLAAELSRGGRTSAPCAP